MSIHEFHASMHSNRPTNSLLTALRQLNQLDDPHAALTATDDDLAMGWPRWTNDTD